MSAGKNINTKKQDKHHVVTLFTQELTPPLEIQLPFNKLQCPWTVFTVYINQQSFSCFLFHLTVLSEPRSTQEYILGGSFSTCQDKDLATSDAEC